MRRVRRLDRLDLAARRPEAAVVEARALEISGEDRALFFSLNPQPGPLERLRDDLLFALVEAGIRESHVPCDLSEDPEVRSRLSHGLDDLVVDLHVVVPIREVEVICSAKLLAGRTTFAS